MSTPSFAVSPTTSKILKNFSAIAGGQITLQEGPLQKVLGGAGENTSSVLAVATLPESWPKETPIYDLDLFIGALSSFEKPAIQFGTDGMVMTNDTGKSALKIKFRYADPSTIKSAKTKELPTNDPDLSFNLSAFALSQLKKTASLLRLSHFTIVVEKDSVKFLAADPKNPNSHVFELSVPNAEVNRINPNFERSMRFQFNHIVFLMDGDYTVSMTEKWKYGYFQSKSSPVAYFVAEDRPE